jgi:hypothetical protein
MGCLDENLSVMQGIDTKFYNEVINAEEPKWYKAHTAKNSDKIFVIEQGSKRTPAYHPDAPRKEIKKNLKGAKFESDSVTIVVGMGLGHGLKIMLNKMEKGHQIILFETVPYLILKAFEVYDFTPYLNDGRLFIVTTADELSNGVRLLDSVRVVNNWQIMIEPYTQALEREYTEAVQKTIELINQVNCNTGTLENAGPIVSKNAILNLPYLLPWPGVAKYKDAYKGLPAVVVSTGPSLANNIHHLMKAQDKVIIIAVAQALRVLLAYDIRPDFIVTVDYGKVNMSHFEGLLDCDVPMVTLDKVYHPIMKRYNGPKIISASMQAVVHEDKSIEYTNTLGELPQGGSVSHMALGFALHIGADPVTLIGQDLAISGERSHVAGADSAGKVHITKEGMILWDVDDPRSNIKGLATQGRAQLVPAYMGGLVPTNTGLLSFITSFTRIAEQADKTLLICNSTEGGAHIPGMHRMTLQDFLKSYALDKLDKTPPAADEEGALQAAEEILPSILFKLNNMYMLIHHCVCGLKALEQMEEAMDGDDNTALEEAIESNEKHSIEAETLARQDQFVGTSIYATSRKIFSKEYKTKKSPSMKNLTHDYDIARVRIARNRIILEAAKEQAESVKLYYKQVCAQLRKAVRYNDINELMPEPPVPIEQMRDDYTEYFETGNFALPLLEARQFLPDKRAQYIVDTCIKMREDAIKEARAKNKHNSATLKYNSTVEEAQKLGRDKGMYEEALEKLEAAYKIDKARPEALWGLGSVHFMLKNFKAAAGWYKKLVEAVPDDHRFKFEYGQVLMHVDVPKGMAQLYEVINEHEQQYAHFLYPMAAVHEKAGELRAAEDALVRYLKHYPIADKAKQALQRIQNNAN